MSTENAEKENHTVSFIIPALNEEHHIRTTLSSIHRAAEDLTAYEIIVVDNGSTDGTDRVAREAGAEVLSLPGVPVAALRNEGACRARYKYLVFLDADVALTREWRQRIIPVLAELNGSTYTIAGSTCGLGVGASSLQRCWWGRPRAERRPKYMNSGHMIVRRGDFLDLGGFDEALLTGEDSEFCQRERNVPVRIFHDDRLRVIHDGYPATVRQFFRRERWHALGDYSSLGIFLRSKPALASVAQFVVLATSLACTLLTSNALWLLLYPLLVLPLCFFAAYSRAPGIHNCLLLNAFLYLVYFNARATALVDIAFQRAYTRKR